VGLSLLLSVVSYEWFEKRFLRLKRLFVEEAPVTGREGRSFLLRF
jgi:hypothetical protein